LSSPVTSSWRRRGHLWGSRSQWEFVVRPEPFGKAPEGREGAGGGASQPWFALGRLAPAEEDGKILRECHRLCQHGRVRSDPRQQLLVSPRALVRCAEDQPGRTARGERAWGPCRHHREGLIAAALPGGQALRLAEPPDIEGDDAVPALKALAFNRAKEVRAVPTPMVPAVQEHGFIGIKEAPITVMPGLPLGKRWVLEIALHGAPTEAHLLRDGVQRPAPAMLRPDLVIVGPPSRPPLAGQARRRGGRRLRGERHRGWRWGCCRTGRIVHRCGGGHALGLERRQFGRVGGEDLGQRVGQILQPMEAVGHLARRGRPCACRFRIHLRAVPHDHLDPGMGLQPLRYGGGLPIREEGQGPSPSEVHQEGAIRVTPAQGEVVHAEDLGEAIAGQGGGGSPAAACCDAPSVRSAGSAAPRPRHPGRGRWRGGVPSAARSAAPEGWQHQAVAR
jgi:hypothetical protein